MRGIANQGMGNWDESADAERDVPVHYYCTIESADVGTFEHYIFQEIFNFIFGDVAILQLFALPPALFKAKEEEQAKGRL